MVALSVVIALWCLVQASPGLIIPETKLDLTVDPLRFLGRSLSAWDPSVSFGRLQNQAVGYLFPMGAFTALTRSLGLPPWLVQRLWISLVLLVGLWGAHRLASMVGIASPAGRVLAAAAYALAPATLATAAFQAGTQLPWSLAPWMLVPLLAAPRLGPRRAAALSGLAVAAMGGINATATLAVLPLAVVWFATRAAGAERRRLLAWWAPCVALAVGWWLIPLVVTVRYGLDFTPFTERAALTTGTQTATDIWRGTGNWLPYVDQGGRTLPGARGLVLAPVAVIGSIVVAALGAWGLARKDAPGRSWLLPATLLGAVALGLGYAGPSGGAGADLARAALDGPIVFLRNVQKFAPLVRLPLALGFGHAVAVLAVAASASVDERRGAVASGGRRPVRALATAAPVLAALAVFAAMWPVVPGRLAPEGAFLEVPDEWQETVAWVDAQPGRERTLLYPGSPFAEYRWGRPLDEPFGLLSDDPWAVRDLIPLGGGGSTRLLDGLEQASTMGELPVGFVTSLRRAGIGHLVVRNDLLIADDGSASPRTVRRLLTDADGLEWARSFGDPTPRRATDHRPGPHPGDLDDDPLPTIDVYEVTAPTELASAYTGSLRVGGAAEALTWLPADVADGRALFFGDDATTSIFEDAPTMATDSARRRDVVFGMIRANRSYTLTADADSPVSGDAPADRWADDREPASITTARVLGAAAIDDDLPSQRLDQPGAQPFAAFDGNPATVWLPDATPVGRSLQVDLDRPTEVGTVTVTVPAATGRRIDRLVVTTDAGSVDGRIDADGRAVITPPAGPTRSVRIEIAAVLDGPVVAPLGIADIAIDGLDLARPLDVALPGGVDQVDGASLSRNRVDRYDLTDMDEDGHLDRLVPFATGRVELSGTATAVVGPDLNDLLADATPASAEPAMEIVGSNAAKGLPEWGPQAALDGDDRTAWVPAMALTDPVLRLTWPDAVTVDAVVIDVVADRDARGVPPSVLDQVVVRIGDEEVVGTPDGDGRISLPATDATELTIRFVTPSRTFDRPLMVAEVAVDGLDGRTATGPDRTRPVDLPCGSGPALTVDGRSVATRSTGTVDDLLTGRSLTWSACAPVTVDGTTRLVADRTGALGIDTLNARRDPPGQAGQGGENPDGTDQAGTDPAGTDQAGTDQAGTDPAGTDPAGTDPGGAGPGGAGPDGRSIDVDHWGSQARTVVIGPGPDAVVATTENHNDGWTAEIDGTSLQPVRVDGWRQGFVVPAGVDGTMELTYGPNRVHRAGIAVGLAGLVALLALALVRGRRSTTDAKAERFPASLAADGQSPGPVVGLVAATAVGVLVGSWTVLALIPMVVVGRRRPRWLPGLVATGIVVAGLVTVAPIGPDWATTNGGFRVAAQVAAVVAWMALALAWTTDPDEEVEPVPGPKTKPTTEPGSGSGPETPKNPEMAYISVR